MHANQQFIPPTYEHIVVEGLPYARGLSHGQQLKEKIHRNVAYYKTPGKLPAWPLTLKVIQESYIPAIELHYPTGLEELRGIADGAHATLEEIVMLNARYDLGRLAWRLPKQNLAKVALAMNDNSHANDNNLSNGHQKTGNDHVEECTSAFFFPETTASGDSLACQNWDMDSHLYHDDLAVYLELHPDSSENRPSMFLLTEVGQLIRTGMNSAGLAVTANSILCTDDFVPVSHTDVDGVYHEMESKIVLPITLARRLFLEYDNFSDALVAVNSMPCHVSGNLHVSTAEGFGMGLEKTPTRVYRVYAKPEDGYVFHSNHILAKGFTGRDDCRDRYSGGSSWFRCQRLERAIRKDARNGALTNEKIHAAFSDHLGSRSFSSGPDSRVSSTSDDRGNRVSQHLDGSDYSWVNSIFYISYLLFEYPLTALLARFSIPKFLGFMVTARGLTLLLANFSNRFAGLATNRFFLGGLESVIAPTFVIITARWYTRQEQPIRQVIWFTGTPVFGIFGGLIGCAVGHIGDCDIASWRIMFIIFGGLTMVWGVVISFFFPSDPSTARFLNAEGAVAASYEVSFSI
ncbi:hypothetical protein G7Y89_g2318 [Cudoniella acicularis]|uniref:Peptidase C45 hydrolase domain-containing protein n=1 Tax=Cudoniella acicularis TaxID=354080 RepID=A0A8H4RTM9_9HELO|nr:hypothetical protein G7Y89_g2318 [Cudoniella acicularis]